MKQEDKDLLLKYLCAALPYGVFVSCAEGTFMGVHWNKVKLDASLLFELQDNDALSNVKPYLRPMSSMTEKDCLSLSKELNLSIRARGGDIYFPHNEDNTLENWNKVNNWLLKNHFDFMGLIPLNLAILVTEQNNPYKN